eukprot:GSChrysophyteH1.ASY1.ANO1.118.1 assembled CDS
MGVHRVEQAFYGVLIFSLILLVNGWNEWKYSTRWSETEEASRTHCSPDCDVCTSQADCDKDESCVWQEDMNRCVGATQSNWQIFWGERPAPGFELSPEDAPRPRRGHSMMTFYDKSNSFAYRGATLVFMFGGRDNEAKFEHIPRTYNVAKVNGTVVFTTYRDKPVNACNDIEEKYYTSEERAGCNFTESSRINVGIFYNDVWAYKMCERSIEPQSTPGYGPLDGSIKAAVDSLLPKVELGSNPSDNVDGTYLDVPIDCVFCTHTHLTSGTPEQALLFDRTAALQNASPKRYFDEPCEDGGWLLIHPGAPEGGCVIQLGILVCNVPSERYGHASAMFDDGTFYVYGGFSQRCADYCDDLWLFDIYLKGWHEVPRDTSTAVNAGPSRRWRHAFSQPMALFGGHRLWQGFTVDNQESNSWSNFDAMPLGGYLDDLWIYTKYLDLITTPGETFKSNDGRWQFIFPKEECFNSPGISWESRFDVSCFTVWPPARAGHGLAYDSPRNGIWIFGGYSTYYPYLKTDGEGSGSGVTQLNKGGFIPYPGFSYWKNDLWFYDIGTGFWTEHVLDPSHNLAWPDGRQDAVFLLLGELLFLHGGFSNNHYYDDTWYYNVTTSKWLEKERFVYPSYPDGCTDDLEYIAKNNCTHLITHNGTLYEHCTSVYGEPTRHTTPPDGMAGRAPGPILARAGHAAVWLPETQEIIMYGGMSYKEENAKRIDETWPSITRDDMWYFGLNHCLNNCSDHGVCKNGFCFCYVGYYGEDCSNTSCPGTSCYYDEYTNDQVCVHACQAGYVHTDDDIYVQDVTKIPCSPDRAGEINGVCDGFGKTQCAPPFIGDDCGTKDCKNNCSFNGWCSIEFPVSRCMCQPGYFGETCEFKLCLNNCSYPNGVCDTSTGFCKCRMMYSPYNQTREYHPWGGEDCSWLYAYQGADKGVMSNSMYLASILIICISLVLAGPSHLLSWGHGLEAVPPEVSTSESVLHDSGS